ncbi:unnamed protein product [Phaeothamnion confervicola]
MHTLQPTVPCHAILLRRNVRPERQLPARRCHRSFRQPAPSPIPGVTIDVQGPLAAFAGDLEAVLKETGGVLARVSCPDMARFVLDAAKAAAADGDADGDGGDDSGGGNGDGGGNDETEGGGDVEAAGPTAVRFVAALARALPPFEDVETVRIVGSREEARVPMYKNAQALAAELHHRVGPRVPQLRFRGMDSLTAGVDADTITGLIGLSIFRLPASGAVPDAADAAAADAAANPAAAPISGGGPTAGDAATNGAAASEAAEASKGGAATAAATWDPLQASFGPDDTAALRAAAAHVCNLLAARLGAGWSALELGRYVAHLGREMAVAGNVRKFVPRRSFYL